MMSAHIAALEAYRGRTVHARLASAADRLERLADARALLDGEDMPEVIALREVRADLLACMAQEADR